jgi:hypothetical protein
VPSFDLTTGTVEELTYGSTVAGVGAVDAPESANWDCSIGELNFLFATSDANPFVRETADFRRQRIDTERNPGEQSIDSGYWIRSQSSFHYGSGLTSAEPLEVNDAEAQFRYKEGGGVNPWTPGQLTLLNSTSELVSDAGTGQLLLGVGTGVLHASGSSLQHVTSGGTATSITWGGSGTIQSLTTDGTNWYAADTTGIYRGALPSGSGSLIWNTGADTVIRFVKSRLMATVGVGVYELTGTGPTLPTPLDPGATRPSGWNWTDISEGPTAIYLSGYVGDTSTIERVTVTTSSSAITLEVPTVVAEMPRGEQVYSLYSYVGAYLITGTSKGCRVALINAEGTLSLGPLVVDDGAVDDAVASGSYVYVTVRDKGNAGDRVQRAGLYRIDLGTNINNNPLDFAHAADLVVPADAPSGASAVQVTSLNDELYICADNAGVYKQDATYVDTGWIEIGRVRLGTIERKGWRDLRLLVEEDAANAAVVTGFANPDEASSPSNWTTTITADGTRPDTTGKLTSAAPSPESNLFVAFSLASADSNATSPVFIGYQLRAVPAPERTRLLSVPVMMFDYITDRKGLRMGKKGLAFDTLSKIQELEESAAVVQWRDFTTGEAATAYIERVTFTRTSPPTNRASGVGGVAVVLLRLV